MTTIEFATTSLEERWARGSVEAIVLDHAVSTFHGRVTMCRRMKEYDWWEDPNDDDSDEFDAFPGVWFRLDTAATRERFGASGIGIQYPVDDYGPDGIVEMNQRLMASAVVVKTRLAKVRDLFGNGSAFKLFADALDRYAKANDLLKDKDHEHVAKFAGLLANLSPDVEFRLWTTATDDFA